jgi:hypothetical protein
MLRYTQHDKAALSARAKYIHPFSPSVDKPKAVAE